MRRTPEFSASSDYRSVRWRDRVISLSPTQAAVIRNLHIALDNGTPELGQAEILEAAASDSKRLRDLFRRGPGAEAWGSLIIPGRTLGSFRLNVSPDGL